MALTPKTRMASSGLQRPSFSHINTVSSPSLRASTTDINRKASLQALTGVTPASMDSDLEVGDAVNVPGDMHGTVKFVGSVRGKAGLFVGVELAPEFATRGKNNGDVDGTHYFQTAIPGSGIFLPVHRAERRSSPTSDSYTSPTPSQKRATNGTNDAFVKPKLLSQSVGPGARPASPPFKAKRPSLPRPESPLRRQPPALAPTPARGLGTSQYGRPSITQTPIKPNLKASTTTRPAVPATTRPYSRTGSRAGHRSDSTIDENDSLAGRGMVFSQSVRSPSRQGLGGAGGQQEEVQRLRAQLAERDTRLNEQAASLAEMEQSIKEFSAFLPADSDGLRSPVSGEEDDNNKSVGQLKQMLREKNEKISKLTAEFDAHRADFRSTLDSLEMASTETERVYEEQKRDLLAQIEELQDAGQSKQDFDGVAQQLKQLEDFVAELEEGLEESRRGEAEARGEVEFLRGEVERGRSELRREREKAAAAMKHSSFTSSGSSSIKDLEQRDDEIRGLKAIIHSLSEAGNMPDTKATSIYSADNDEEIRRLQKALDDVKLEKESLEDEVEQLRRERTHTNGTHARNESELTEKAFMSTNGSRPRSDTVKASSLMPDRLNLTSNGTTKASKAHGGGGDVEGIYCEMCESADHDTLECTKLDNVHTQASRKPAQQDAGANKPKNVAHLDKENHIGDSKAEAQITNIEDAEKWCALCEKDGHLAFDCPEEQY